MNEKTLGQRIAEIREKWEPYRFRYFRVLRTMIFYWLFMKGVSLSVVSDETLEENPMMGHGSTALSILILFVLLAGIFILKETVSFWQIICCIVIILAVYGVNYTPRSKNSDKGETERHDET